MLGGSWAIGPPELLPRHHAVVRRPVMDHGGAGPSCCPCCAVSRTNSVDQSKAAPATHGGLNTIESARSMSVHAARRSGSSNSALAMAARIRLSLKIQRHSLSTLRGGRKDGRHRPPWPMRAETVTAAARDHSCQRAVAECRVNLQTYLAVDPGLLNGICC